MLKSKKSLIIILFISIFSVGVISIAFAALSQTLNITSGKVTQNALTWNVGFVAGTYTGTPDGTSSNGLSCGNVTATRNTLTVNNTTLSKPDDVCTYSIPISNTGDLTAYLQSITYTAPTSTSCTINNLGDDSSNYGNMTCGNIKYYLHHNTTCSFIYELKPSVTRYLYIEVSYIGEDLNSTSSTQKNAKVNIVYTDDQSLAYSYGQIMC